MSQAPINRMEQPEIWGGLKDKPDILEKVRIFREMIPEDVETIVDVGCGDGAITNELGQQWTVIGVDSSRAALRHLTTKAVLADARELPFSDASFDMALSSQMLEHLDKAAYDAGIGELRRVARKYVLISVPYCEDLDMRRIQCPACGRREHVWGHVRRFTPESVMQDFADFEPLDIRIFGDMQQPPWPKPLLWAAHNIFKSWYPPEGQHPQCSRCGNTDFSKMRRFSRLLYLVKVVIDRIRSQPQAPFWLAVLARRRLIETP